MLLVRTPSGKGRERRSSSSCSDYRPICTLHHHQSTSIAVLVKLWLLEFLVVSSEGIRHTLECTDGQASHLLKLVDEFDPFYSSVMKFQGEVKSSIITKVLSWSSLGSASLL